MTRATPAALALLALAAGCGGTAPRPVARGCVRVYFRADATRVPERALRQRLAAEPRVVRVRFVSKAQALAKMIRKYPELFTRRRLPFNPLPDALLVETRDVAAARALTRALGHGAGVATVKGPVRRAC